MISPAELAAFLPPTFQILTGLTFAALLLIRFMATPMLRPLWGKLFAFAVLVMALGFFLMSVGTAKTSFSGAAESLTLAGASFFLAVVLVAVAFIIGSRSLAKGIPS